MFDEHSLPGTAEPSRSDRSLEFEAFWRGLPRSGLVPHRRDVKPARAAQLLRDMVMLEARFGEAASLRIRLAGSAIQERIQKDVTGHDYLDFRPQELRDETIELAKIITGRPCGRWQTLAIHFARGFAQNFEFTAFPLLGDGVSLILGLLQPLGGLVSAVPLAGLPMLAEPANMLQFIDIGAGRPVLPA